MYLPSDRLFHDHLEVRTPAVVDEPVPNWASDDSDTERLFSAAEELISAQAAANSRPCFAMPAADSAETPFTVKGNDEPVAAVVAIGEPRSSSPAFSETGVSRPGQDVANTGPVCVSRSCLVMEVFGDAPVLLVPPDILSSLSPDQISWRAEFEPAPSGVPDMVQTLTSVPADVQEAAVPETWERNDDFAAVSQVPLKSCLSTSAVDFQSSMVSASNVDAPDHNRAAGPSTTGSGFPPEESFFPPSVWKEVRRQSPGPRLGGARPKVPPTAAVGVSQIPVFVELEELSDDEMEVVPSSTLVVSADRCPLQAAGVGPDTTSGASSVVLPVVLPSATSSDQPVVSDIGLLAELDLRNNLDDSVGSFVINKLI